jgi:transposase-like protein
MEEIKELQKLLDLPQTGGSSVGRGTEPASHDPIPPKGTDEWKAAIVEAVHSGEGSTSVARRFGTDDRQVRRFVRKAHGQEPEPVAGKTIDPALLGEDA